MPTELPGSNTAPACTTRRPHLFVDLNARRYLVDLQARGFATLAASRVTFESGQSQDQDERDEERSGFDSGLFEILTPPYERW